MLDCLKILKELPHRRRMTCCFPRRVQTDFLMVLSPSSLNLSSGIWKREVRYNTGKHCLLDFTSGTYCLATKFMALLWKISKYRFWWTGESAIYSLKAVISYSSIMALGLLGPAILKKNPPVFHHENYFPCISLSKLSTFVEKTKFFNILPKISKR